LEDPLRPAAELARPELLVPESRRVVDLLGDMQSSGLHFAVVVDEHGGTEGIATIEDVVAQLVGDITDPEKRRDPAIHRIGRARWRADAAIGVEAVEAAIGVELPAGDWTTLGGLLVANAGRIPERGDVLEIGGLRFQVIDARPQRIVTIEVSHPPT
jgi:CBS domain containing-hemolysin-like protein